MSEPAAPEGALSGQRLLWTQPEVLDKSKHGGLGLRRVDAPFRFAAESRGIPLTLTEFRSAQADFPIVFTEGEEIIPLAAVGLEEKRNLFVDGDGRWAEGAYIPAYVRAHPFALARTSGDRMVLVLDRASEAVTDAPDVPFFDGDGLSQDVQRHVEFCRSYETETQRTQAFCRRLAELDLLSIQSVRSSEGEEDLVRFRAVDVEALGRLGADTVDALFREGHLAAIYAHLFSLDRWGAVLQRRAAVDAD